MSSGFSLLRVAPLVVVPLLACLWFYAGREALRADLAEAVEERDAAQAALKTSETSLALLKVASLAESAVATGLSRELSAIKNKELAAAAAIAGAKNDGEKFDIDDPLPRALVEPFLLLYERGLCDQGGSCSAAGTSFGIAAPAGAGQPGFFNAENVFPANLPAGSFPFGLGFGGTGPEFCPEAMAGASAGASCGGE